MTDTTDKLNLTDGQKTRLLGLALESHKPSAAASEDEERGDLLWDILRRPMPMGLPLPNAVSVAAPGSCPGLGSLAGSALDELLQDPRTDVAVLREIKEHAKTLGEQAASKVEKDVFLAVYFAAIAAAWLYHSQRITEHSAQDLTRFLGLLAQAPWMSADLKRLFTEAVQHCGT